MSMGDAVVESLVASSKQLCHHSSSLSTFQWPLHLWDHVQLND